MGLKNVRSWLFLVPNLKYHERFCPEFVTSDLSFLQTSDLSLHYLAKAKIMVIRDVERNDVEFICKVFNYEITTCKYLSSRFYDIQKPHWKTYFHDSFWWDSRMLDFSRFFIDGDT